MSVPDVPDPNLPRLNDIDLLARNLSAFLDPMLDAIPSVLAAKERVDLCPPQDLDITDLIQLFDYTARGNRLAGALEQTRQAGWPPGAAEVVNAVAGINETLRRPFPSL